jgi:benzoylformate decarboxylase
MSATSLSATQWMVLSAASQRGDHCAMLPPRLRGGAAQKVVKKLLDLGLVPLAASVRRSCRMITAGQPRGGTSARPSDTDATRRGQCPVTTFLPGGESLQPEHLPSPALRSPSMTDLASRASPAVGIRGNAVLSAAMTSSHTGITVRQATLDLLRGFGMTTVFGNPGSTELPFLDNWPSDFRYILALQEASAVAMADGYARATGRAAFCNLHSAVGIGHAAGNIFTAFRNQAPLVISAGQQVRSLLPLNPFLGAKEAANFPKPYVKWSCEPARAEDVPAALAHAYYVAMQKPYGPTFVSIPIDDWSVETDPIVPRTIGVDAAPDPDAIASLAHAIESAKRPAFVIGPEVDIERAGDAAVALAERVRAPVWATPFSHHVCFPEEHPLFAGFLSAAPEAVSASLSPHDLIVVLGAPVFTFHVGGECALFESGIPLYQITTDGDSAASAPVGTSIVCSLRLALSALIERLSPSDRPEPARRKRAAPPAPADPIQAEFLLHTLGRTMPPEAIIVEEAPSHRPAMQERLPMRSFGRFYTMASGSLGYSLPASVGFSLADPSRRVICLIGDGSMMYSVQALWTAVQHKLPLTVVVINNGGYGAMRAFSRVLKVKNAPGIDLPGLDFVRLATGMGCPGVRVTKADQLESTLAPIFEAGGPHLVDVVVDPVIPMLYDDR